MTDQIKVSCPVCGRSEKKALLARALGLSPEVQEELTRMHAGWESEGGACPGCVETALLMTLLDDGETALHHGVQSIWPLDAEAAFGAIPTPLRMHADPRYTGKGVTLAMVDSAFYPHPGLIKPSNRIRAWVNAVCDPVDVLYFKPDEEPRWPGWDSAAPEHWHGQMTSVVAAGNGWLSDGFYRGLANEAELVLIQTMNAQGHITNETIIRALRWLRENARDLGVRVVNLSLGGEPVAQLAGNPVDAEVAALVHNDIVVVVAAGNDGVRRLVPPATAPQALTVGGVDDGNTFHEDEIHLWHSSYGDTAYGAHKPEVVAPSIWVAAPVLPVSDLFKEAQTLFERRAAGDSTVENRIAELKLISPFYQHVDGTSFAAPIVSGTVACMLQAHTELTPFLVRQLLIKSAHPIPGVPVERQGAGAVDAGKAVSHALREHSGPLAGHPMSPEITSQGISFLIFDDNVEEVQVIGSWDDWRVPGLRAAEISPGIWKAQMPLLTAGRYYYKFLLGSRWLDDPANPIKSPDGLGALNSVLDVREYF